MLAPLKPQGGLVRATPPFDLAIYLVATPSTCYPGKPTNEIAGAARLDLFYGLPTCIDSYLTG